MKLFGLKEPGAVVLVPTWIVGAPDNGKNPQVDLTIEREDRGEFTVHIDVNEYYPAQKSTGRDTPDDDGYVHLGNAWDDDGKSVTLTREEIEEAEGIVLG